MISRTITCAACGQREEEKAENAGWQGWGGIHGVVLNGCANPHLCPECMARVMEFIDGGMKHGVD